MKQLKIDMVLKGSIKVIRRLTAGIFIGATALIILSTGCKKIYDEEAPGILVPPTADQDPNLPQLTINVAGQARAVHLQTFGDSSNPAVFVLHGGPGADFRLLLPLKALADSFYVVMWDSRGAGLSERVTKSELTLESFNEEIAQIKKALVPNRKVSFVGHSFGGEVMTRYTCLHPEDVNCLVLIEPGKLDLSLAPTSNGGDVNFLDGQGFFWQNELMSSKDHATADYKAVGLLRESSRNWTCDHSIIEHYPFWRYGAYHYYVVMNDMYRLPHDYNWAYGIESFDGPITVISGTCGALSENYQKKTNLLTLPDAYFIPVKDANHITLFTDYATGTIAAVKGALKRNR